MILSITAGPGAGTRFEFTAPAAVVLGRDADADVRLDDHQCSRQHARIVLTGSAATVEDLGSTNGILHNGRRVARAVLRENDELALGSSRLRVSGLAQSVSPAPALRVQDATSSVLVSLHHTHADLLGAAALPLDPGDAARENRTMRQVCEMVQVAVSQPDVPRALEAVAERLRAALDADTACVLARGDDGAWTVRAAATGGVSAPHLTVSRTIVQAALDEGMAILSTDAAGDERFAGSASIVAQHIASAVCSPLAVKGEFAGVLLCDRRAAGRPFQPLDLRVVATVGNVLTMLIEREKLQAEARRRERLATVGEVMASMAHCIKNIITGMNFTVATLRRALEQARYDVAERSAASMAAQERRLAGLVLDLLSYGKERVPVRAELDVRAVVEEVAAPFVEEAGRDGIALAVAAADGCPPIWAERAALERVFLNLLSNALDAVRARGTPGPREVRVALEPAAGGDGVAVRVRDTGTGIPAAQVPKIFDVFFSTKGSAGTGLGLPVARQLVQEHGGTLTVDSREGEWTEFVVALPRGSPPAQPFAPAAGAAEGDGT